MPRLPSARDVSNVSPRIQSDPGVSAPAQAFDSPLGVAAQELAPAADRFAQVKFKQENRRDTVDRASRINNKAREGDLELSRLNTEEDLSNEEVLSKYGAFLSERNKTLIEEHRKQGASEDSIASLTMRLNDIDADLIGKASGISVELGRKKVLTTFNDSLAPLALKASQNPTLEGIDGLFLGLETQIGDIRAAIDPSQEEELRKFGREQITLSAVDGLITKGRIETAESMLADGGLVSNLSVDKQRDIMRKIETVRAARDSVLLEISQAEAVLGRSLTEQERLMKLGLAPKTPLVNINQAGETARAKAEGEAMAKITTEQLPALRKASGQLEAMRSMLEQGAETGGFRRLQLSAANFFGVTPESLSNLAAFQAVSNAATLTKTTELKGAISEKELDFVQGTVAGAGTGTKANVAILKIQSKLLQREQDSLRLMSNYHTIRGNLSGFEEFLQNWAETNPMFSQDEIQEIQSNMGTAQQVPIITDQASYDALPAGASYKTQDGKTAVKGGAKRPEADLAEMIRKGKP